MTDFRALCARMADELDHYQQLLMDDRRETHALAIEARAALARWGQPATPIPVAERLPGPEDLDRESTCWMFHPINLHYCLCMPDPSIHTHWLPANALPVPPQ